MAYPPGQSRRYPPPDGYSEKQMKPYAIVKMTTLKALHFDSKQEWKDAMSTLKAREVEFLALKYVPELEKYTQLEVY